ncbi:MAG: hypothetical protein H6831_01465 [Planctomycetes bacterium]|nr:hypothetical protein [Planctomycetota bacterium]
MKHTPILALACLAASCSTYRNHHVRAEGASDEHFRMFTELQGDWYFVDENGDPTDDLALSYELTGGGSAVMERVFPGQDHEMVTMYYMDGGNLMLTHYCAVGNQPTMIEMPTDSQRVVIFEFYRGTNLDPSTSSYMHDAKFEFLDVDRMRSTWRFYKEGKPAGEEVMDVIRVEDHDEM